MKKGLTLPCSLSLSVCQGGLWTEPHTALDQVLSIPQSSSPLNASTRSVMEGLLAFCECIAAGVLVHGPLLGWARQRGDRIAQHTEVLPNGDIWQYAMPKARHDSMQTSCRVSETPWSRNHCVPSPQ